jgi:hypothetical protein
MLSSNVGLLAGIVAVGVGKVYSGVGTGLGLADGLGDDVAAGVAEGVGDAVVDPVGDGFGDAFAVGVGVGSSATVVGNDCVRVHPAANAVTANRIAKMRSAGIGMSENLLEVPAR